MKKFILSVVAVAAFASYNVYRSNNNETEGMSDTMLANVEALANNYEASIIECNRNGCVSNSAFDCYFSDNGTCKYCPDMVGQAYN